MNEFNYSQPDRDVVQFIKLFAFILKIKWFDYTIHLAV